MNRIDYYLDIVPLPVVVIAAAMAVVVFLAVPARHRLFIAIMLVPPWLTVAQLLSLGTVQAVAKVSSSLAFFLVAVSALLHPGQRRRIPGILWLYPIMAVVAFVYVLTVEDRTLALALRMQWLMLTLAAVTICRTINTSEDLVRVVNALAMGCIVAVMLPLSGLLLFPTESFMRGIARFQPYGVNSNQIGMLFALAVPLMTYIALTTRRVTFRPALYFLVAVTIGMALITGSRNTMLSIVIVMLPILLRFSKRPIATVMAIGIGLVGVSFLLKLADTDALQRFTSLETSRLQIWAGYVPVIMDRPLTGLLGTVGQSVLKDAAVGQHAHNAYLEMMYIGGLSYALPMLILVAYSTISTIRVWRVRTSLGTDPLLISVLATLLLVMYLQGLANQVVYWPTYSWSFLHVILASLFVTLANDLSVFGASGVLPSREGPFDEHDEQWGTSAELMAEG